MIRYLEPTLRSVWIARRFKVRVCICDTASKIRVQRNDVAEGRTEEPAPFVPTGLLIDHPQNEADSVNQTENTSMSQNLVGGGLPDALPDVRGEFPHSCIRKPSCLVVPVQYLQVPFDKTWHLLIPQPTVLRHPIHMLHIIPQIPLSLHCTCKLKGQPPRIT